MEQSSQKRGPRARRPWTDEDQRRAEELRAQGLTLARISELTGWSRSAVRCRLDPDAYRRQLDAVKRCHARIRRQTHGERRKWTIDEQRQAESLMRQGLSYYAIGVRMGRDRSTVRYWMSAVAKEHACHHARAIRRARIEKAREAGRRRYAANPEYFRDASRRYRAENPGSAKASFRRWSQANRDKIREIARRRNALKRSARGRSIAPLSLAARIKRFAVFGDSCAYCGSLGRMTVDHVLPLALGGLDEAANIVPACHACNSSKRERPVEQWYCRQPFFSESRWRLIQRHCPGAVGQLSLAIDSSVAA